jgi:hypothetical protein
MFLRTKVKDTSCTIYSNIIQAVILDNTAYRRNSLYIAALHTKRIGARRKEQAGKRGNTKQNYFKKEWRRL